MRIAFKSVTLPAFIMFAGAQGGGVYKPMLPP